MNKYEKVKEIIKKEDIKYSSFIDVGCRDTILKKYLGEPYYGIDVDSSSNADELVDISQQTRFTDNEFDLLVALDVAEHTDNMYETILEMIRISKNSIIALPNMYAYVFRYRFLMGRPLSGKYALNKRTCYSGGERHRWLFNMNEAIKLFEEASKELHVDVSVDYYFGTDLKMYQKLLVNFTSPSFSSEVVFFTVKKRS